MAESKSAATTAKKPAARKTTRKPAVKKTVPRQPDAERVPEEHVELSSNDFGTINERPSPTMTVKEYTEAERQGLLASYTALKGAGLPVPDDIAQPVEAWIKMEEERRAAEAAERAKVQEVVQAENAAGPWFVRNGYSAAPFSLRLERQTERRRIELKPRGVPGDMHPLEDADLNDPVLRRNVDIGVCEVIPAGEAKRIADQQTTNVVSRIHTPTAILRNAKGEEYSEGAIRTEVSYDDRGITVGVIDPEQIQGKYEDRAVANAPYGGIQRTTDAAGQPVQKREVASQFIPTSGNPHIIETGPVAGSVPQLDMAKAKIADDLARRTQANPLSGMRVTVTAPQKS